MGAILASTGPFGPTIAGCLLLPVLLVGPFIIVPLVAVYLLRPNPMPSWLLATTVACMLFLAYRLWPFDKVPFVTRTFDTLWWNASLLSVLLLPALVVREGFKREWFHRPKPKRRRKRKQQHDDLAPS